MYLWTIFWILCGIIGYGILTGSFKYDFEKMFKGNSHASGSQLGQLQSLQRILWTTRVLVLLSGPIGAIVTFLVLCFAGIPIEIKFALFIPKTFWDRYYKVL